MGYNGTNSLQLLEVNKKFLVSISLMWAGCLVNNTCVKAEYSSTGCVDAPKNVFLKGSLINKFGKNV
jgi:hypothetical protein